MKFIEYADADMMAIDVANIMAGELENTLFHEERVSFAVPGGETPGPVFDNLCAVDLDWSRVDVFLTDERWLPEDHPRSNTRFLRQRLLTDKAAAAVYHPLYIPAEKPEDVLAELESSLVSCQPISVLLLGMGADMHCASLLPGAEGLVDALAVDAPLLVPIRSPDAAETRVTLSARVLDSAVSKHLVITGRRKRDALERGMHLPPDEAPIAAVMDGLTVHWAPE
ncbi:MAG: 6-phosphogluconolactonase [Rhodobacteraceae bacterium HLUCCO07]|nr:MAG: 6-phosphogluconolactonase [Rhodobacteraceae bacterium HLUCCO07]